MARWRGVVYVASLLVLVGCGSVTGGARVSPSPSTAPTASLALTEEDAGKTFRLRSGQVVSVALHQAPGYTEWAGLHSSNPAVLAPTVDTRRLAVRGVTLGSFRAAAAGTAQLMATSGTSCPPLQPCPDLARAWVVTIQVS